MTVVAPSITGVTNTQTPTPVSRPLKVVLLEDDPMARLAIAAILESAEDIEVVGEGKDGTAALPLVQLHNPDVVVTDIRMPRMNGIEATAAIRALPEPPQVLVLTGFTLDEYVFDALNAGAGGYLLKDDAADHITGAVRVLARGEAMLSPRSTKTLIGHFVDNGRSPRRADARAKLELLTDRERQITLAVAQGKSNAEIGADLFLSEVTVKTHLSRTYPKLGVGNRVQLAIFAYRAGLVAP